MAKKVFNMQGGLHSAAAYSAFENRLNGSVKASPDSFIVSAGSGMNVSISTGDGLISVDNFNARRIQTTTAETALTSAANASFNRIDSVVAYIDNSVTPSTAQVDNTNDILKFKVVPGTAASTPAAPTGAAIQSSIGAGNPYMILANVTVPQSATNLAGATFDNIAPTPLLKNYPIGAVFISVNNTNPQTLFGGKWAAFASGRTLIGVDAAQAEFDTVEETGGAKTNTHNHWIPVANTPSSDPAMIVGAVTPVRRVGRTFRHIGAGTQYTDNIDERSSYSETIPTLPPYITTYMWKRTG